MKTKTLRLALGLASLFCMMATLELPAQTNKKSDAPANQTDVPKEQEQFVAAVEPFIGKYLAAQNEVKKTLLRTQRKAAIEGALKSRKAEDWVGRMSYMATSGKSAFVSIRLSGGTSGGKIEVSAKGIPITSELFEKLADINKGTRVRMSFAFKQDEDDFVSESSISEKGGMTEPDFEVTITKIEALK